jgi:endonuclease/exonuclease/phosphatase family metal-dependent hydrolase
LVLSFECKGSAALRNSFKVRTMERGRGRWAQVVAATLIVAALGCHRERGAVVTVGPVKGAKMRIMTYNILNGGESKVGGVENRGDIVRKVIAAQKPDIVGLDECANWQRDNAGALRRFERALDMSAVMAVTHGLNVSLLVRRGLPILEVLTDTKRQAHGLVVVEVAAPDGMPLKIFVTHLNPFKPDERMKEVAEIVRYIGKDERCVVMGDLNSLSGRDKFKIEDIPENSRGRFAMDGAIHTGVIDALEKAGLVDAYRLKRPEPKPSDRTVGTTISEDKAHAGTRLRLDYIFITANLTPAVQSVEVIQTDETNHASDHFPLVLDLKF